MTPADEGIAAAKRDYASTYAAELRYTVTVQDPRGVTLDTWAVRADPPAADYEPAVAADDVPCADAIMASIREDLEGLSPSASGATLPAIAHGLLVADIGSAHSVTWNRLRSDGSIITTPADGEWAARTYRDGGELGYLGPCRVQVSTAAGWFEVDLVG